MSEPARIMQNQQTALSVIDAVNLQQVSTTMQKIGQFQAVVQKTLKQNHDFGIIPGHQALLLNRGQKNTHAYGLNQ